MAQESHFSKTMFAGLTIGKSRFGNPASPSSKNIWFSGGRGFGEKRNWAIFYFGPETGSEASRPVQPRQVLVCDAVIVDFLRPDRLGQQQCRRQRQQCHRLEQQQCRSPLRSTTMHLRFGGSPAGSDLPSEGHAPQREAVRCWWWWEGGGADLRSDEGGGEVEAQAGLHPRVPSLVNIL